MNGSLQAVATSAEKRRRHSITGPGVSPHLSALANRHAPKAREYTDLRPSARWSRRRLWIDAPEGDVGHTGGLPAPILGSSWQIDRQHPTCGSVVTVHHPATAR